MSSFRETTTTYVESLFNKDLPSTIVYHNFELTQRMVKSTEDIIEKTKISANEAEILVLASLFLNAGYTKTFNNPEQESVKIAKAFLESQGASAEIINGVCECIQSTADGDVPESNLEKIMNDVKTSDYGMKRFDVYMEYLRQENELHGAIYDTESVWLDEIIKMLTNKHKFYTEYALENWKPRKDKNVAKFFKAKAKFRKGTQKEKLKAKYKVKFKNEDPERGVQTFYRVALRNHIKLSDIADTKANILLSVNAIIISLILSNLISKLDNPSNSYMITPTIIFIIFSIISMVLSILATRPNVTSGEFTPEDVKNKKVNLSFFGNFHKMELKYYEDALKTMLDDKEYIYSALAKDLYFLGVVLNRKYKILRITYTIFMIGIIVSVLAFGIMFKAQDAL